MASRRFENMWQMMSNNNFEKNNEFNDDIICMICDKIMIKACNGPCGCRYCWECIETYLDGIDKYCPGKSIYCEDEMINVDRNILIDQPINIKISRTIVKCPQNYCEFRDELNSMDSHIASCYISLNCPFANIGCTEDKISFNEMKDHIADENYSHSKLLIELINNFRNELESLKIENDNLNREIRNLKLDGESKQSAILELQTNETLHGLVIEELNEKINRLNNENQSIKDELNRLNLSINTEHTTIFDWRDELDNKLDHFISKYEKIDQTIVECEQKNTEAINYLNNCKENMKIKIKKIQLNQSKQNCGEFIWKIENFSKTTNDIDMDIFSDSFYSYRNGYKLCLKILRNGFINKKLSVFFCIMQGEFDDVLLWPFMYDVTISIIDQQMAVAYGNWTIKYNDNKQSNVWNKPTIKRNSGIGYCLMELNELLANDNLYRNDQIFIKCSLDIN